MSDHDDRAHLDACTICEAGAGEPCAWTNVTHSGRRWELGITAPGGDAAGGTRTLVPTGGRCSPTVEDKNLDDDCVWRGACLGCGWHGPTCDNENVAVEDALDHALTGWRDLPVVPTPPYEGSRQRWAGDVAALYAAFGIDPMWLPGSGAPYRTYRQPFGTRSHYDRAVSGFNVNAGEAPSDVSYSPQLSLF